MIVLGIETSCDDTGIAIFDSCNYKVLANIVCNQFSIHQKFGGIVPNLAAKEHLFNILPTINLALKKAKINLNDINLIAYTSNPGLAGSLMMGAVCAKTLSLIYNIPAVAVNHLEGHLFSPFLSKKNLPISYPYIALIISGGHTEIIHIKSFGEYYILGKTLDDAIGEAFDKVAKMLSLPMPGGKNLEKLASNIKFSNIILPIPMIKHSSLNLSFSGLKTAVSKICKKSDTYLKKSEIAFAFQEVAIKSLIAKLKKAIIKTNIKNIVIVGGVSVNKKLRELMNRMVVQNLCTIYFPEKEYCTDNGAMIALVGFYKFINNIEDQNLKIIIKPKASLENKN